MRTSRELAAWIAQGERGAAADTLVEHLTKIPLCDADAFGCYPRTPVELRHCLALIEAVPSLRGRLDEAAELGPQWSTLIEHWPELEEVFRREQQMTRDGSDLMPQTYLRLSELLDGAGACCSRSA